MSKKLVMIESITMYRIRHVIEVEAADDATAIQLAQDDWILEQGNVDFNEFSQKHMGDMDISGRIIDQDEYLKIFDEDNDYMSGFPVDKKLSYINRIKK